MYNTLRVGPIFRTTARQFPGPFGEPIEMAYLAAMGALQNARHESFCRLVSKGESASKAYSAIYHVRGRTAENSGSRLMGNDGVQKRIAELQGQAAKKTLIDIEFLTNELLENARLARQAKQFAAVTSSLGLIAKLHGLVVDRQESVVQHRPAPLPTHVVELSETEWIAQFGGGTGPLPALTDAAKQRKAAQRKLNGHRQPEHPTNEHTAVSRLEEIDLNDFD